CGASVNWISLNFIGGLPFCWQANTINTTTPAPHCMNLPVRFIYKIPIHPNQVSTVIARYARLADGRLPVPGNAAGLFSSTAPGRVQRAPGFSVRPDPLRGGKAHCVFPHKNTAVCSHFAEWPTADASGLCTRLPCRSVLRLYQTNRLRDDSRESANTTCVLPARVGMRR